MIFKSVTVGELTVFVASNEFTRSKIIPITSQRAFSQFKNPRADKNDTALILAYDDNNEMIGYVGSLPDKINNNEKVFWNTCWWVNAEHGGKVAMPLLYKFLQVSNGKVIMKDLTPHTQQIIEKTGLFKNIKTITGIRFFLRLYTGQLISKKKFFIKHFAFLFLLPDFLANNIYVVFRKISMLLNETGRAGSKIIFEIDDESNLFIKKHNANELLKREKEELNWIIQNPWVIHPRNDSKNECQRYPFSSVAKSFKNYILKISLSDNLIGVVFLSQRDGHFKTLYSYIEQQHAINIANEIKKFLYGNNAKSFLTFNYELNKIFSKTSLFCYYKKKISEDLVVANELIPLLPSSFVIQDGEGDCAFT